MKNLKNEGSSPLILSRTTRKPPETRQIPLDLPCIKCGGGAGKLGAGRQPRESSLLCTNCGSFIKWLSASELKGQFSKNLTKPLPADQASLDKFKPKATLGAESDLHKKRAESKATEGIDGFDLSSESGQLGLNLTKSLPANNGSLVKNFQNEGGEA